VTETYTWSAADTAGTIDSSGLYTAGSTDGTDTVTATGDTTGESTTAAVTVITCTAVVTISPESATVQVGATQQFSATTDCDGSVTGSYTWAVTGGGSIDTDGLYTAGSAAGTDTITVTDTANQSATDTATVTVTETSISVTPSSVWRSRWVPLPALMFIEGTGTSFAFLSTTPVYTPAAAVIALPAIVWGPESMWQLILVNPAWLAGIADETPQTVTVTVGTDTDTITVELLPFILDEN
jgi:hypothetical protein